MLRYAVVVLFAVAGVSHALSDAEKAVKPKSECDKKASNCLSFPNSFKCAMSFKNLTDDINILDIIPDLINQPGVTLTDEIKEELVEREINFPAFDIADVCSNKIKARKRSNARCYAFLQDYADENIDSCDTGLITSDGEEINEGTVGDALCERMFNFTFPDEATRKKAYAESWGQGASYGCTRPCRERAKCPDEPNCSDCPWKKYFDCVKIEQHGGVLIGAYHSYCGTDWQEVSTGKGKSRKTLDLKKPLCCNKPADPVCKGGKITGNADELPKWAKSLELFCKTQPHPITSTYTIGCPCPELPVKPMYWPCLPSKFNRVCSKKK